MNAADTEVTSGGTWRNRASMRTMATIRTTGALDDDRAGPARRLVAGGQLPHGRADLPPGQPAAARAAGARPTSSPACSGTGAPRPGLSFLYAHLNRVIRRDELDMIFVTGPGHGGPALVANTYLEGSYTDVYPDVGRDLIGLQRLFRQFSTPGGIPSHVQRAHARARSTRAASWATPWCTPSARCSTTPT